MARATVPADEAEVGLDARPIFGEFSPESESRMHGGDVKNAAYGAARRTADRRGVRAKLNRITSSNLCPWPYFVDNHLPASARRSLHAFL